MRRLMARLGCCLAASALMAGALIAAGTVRGQAQTKEEPRFRIEIQAEAKGGPKFTMTNLTGRAVTACQIESSVSSEGRREMGMSWDATVQIGDSKRPRSLEPGASVTLNLPRRAGGPLPDKIEVVAGIWEDGETFGEAKWVKNLLDIRAGFAAGYEQAIAFLQQGLDENWTRGQYLTALKGKANSGPFYAIRSTLQANPSFDSKPKLLEAAMKNLLEHFTRNLTALRKAKPAKE